MATNYPGSVTRDIWPKLGERPSVLDWGFTANDGSTDASPIVNGAITDVLSLGGRELYFPSGTYKCNSVIDSLVAGSLNIRLTGDGPATVIKRGGTIGTGKGLFDVYGSDVEFANMCIDGDVLTSLGLQYGVDFNGIGGNDPMADSLTVNTSFWVHGGASRVRFINVRIIHSGGYAILLDARTDYVTDVKILGCTLENNRPNTFGTTLGDLIYGSWTGGIFYKGDCVSPALSVVQNLIVDSCTFSRNTGNCVWGHVYGFDALHSNINVTNNHFIDCGLDAILYGGVTGGACTGNQARRVGYVCSDDTSASVPLYLTGANATGIDTSGLVKGVAYGNNRVISVYGGCMDLDGYGQGSVTGNTCILPESGTPEYTEDLISTLTTGRCYGIQPSNSSNTQYGAADITITGNTLINMQAGAIRLFAARNCQVSGNNIRHPAGAVIEPIRLGNIGTGTYQRSYGNVVQDNQIEWSPAGIAAAVQEQPGGSAFSGTDKNWVLGNKLFGNCYEFLKNTNTISVTEAVYTTQAVSTDRADIVFKREGLSTSAYSSWYSRIGASSDSLVMRLYDTPALLNVAVDGGVTTGAFSTGGRTVLAIIDVVATGHLYGDGFLALTDTTFTYPNDASADVFPDTTGMLRYNSSSKVFEQSITVSAGHRVWTTFGVTGVSSVTGTANQVDATPTTGAVILTLSSTIIVPGSFTMLNDRAVRSQDSGGTPRQLLKLGTANDITFGTTTGINNIFFFNGSTAALTVEASTGRIIVRGQVAGQAIAITNGYVAALDTTYGGFQASGNAYNIIQAPSGGCYVGLGYTTDQALYPKAYSSSGSLNTPGAGYGGFGYKSANAYWYWNSTSSAWASIDFLNPSFSSVDASAASAYKVGGVQIVSSGRIGTLEGLLINGVAYNSIQAPLGGCYVGLGYTTDQALYPHLYVSSASLNSPAANYGGLGYKGGNSYWYWNSTSAAWASVDLSAVASSGVSSITGTANQVIVSSPTGAVTLSLPQNINTSAGVTFGTVTTSGVFQSGATGASISFQNTNFNFQVDGNGNISSAATINASGAAAYKVAGTMIIDSSRNATFGVITSSGVIQSGVTGASISFQNTNANFQVDGNGNISGAGSINMVGTNPYKVGGVTIVDSSRNGVNFNTMNATFGFKVGLVTVIDGSRNGNFVNVTSAGVFNVVGSFAEYQVNGVTAINSSNQFVGGGVDCNAGVGATGYNIHGGAYFGQTSVGLALARAGGGTVTLDIRGGIITAVV